MKILMELEVNTAALKLVFLIKGEKKVKKHNYTCMSHFMKMSHSLDFSENL
jgi:hypothetical protein